MPSAKRYTCEYCGKKGYKSEASLHQHQSQTAACFSKLTASLGCDYGSKATTKHTGAASHLPFASVNPHSRPALFDDLLEKPQKRSKNSANMAESNPRPDYGFPQQYQDYDDNLDLMLGDSNNDEVLVEENEGQIDDSMRQQFLDYVASSKEFIPFTHQYITAITLLIECRKTSASLGTYEAMYKWHLQAIGKLSPYESLKTSLHFVDKKEVYKMLKERYNMGTGYINETTIVLPSSKAEAKIVWNDAKMIVQSLLVEPRATPDDYLWFDDNPFAPPPPELDYIADLNTGKSYLETYKKLITKPGKQILMPTPLYIDGAATGHFVDLPITPVKIALGIHTRVAREKAHFWGTLGYIPSPTKIKSKGKRQLVDSGHADGTINYFQMLENEGQIGGTNHHPSQDLHAMLDVIMASYIKLQKTGGVKWDLMYKGKRYEGVEFVFFVPFIRCDTDEADKLCGSYTSRGKGVAQLCRYCRCPTDQSDDPEVSFPKKTATAIARLVEANRADLLKEMSQQNIANCFHNVRFGLHTDQGVHGATPIEMLHALLLGIFVTVRDTFFEQCGPDSQLAKDLNALATEFGMLLSRQSDRSLPKTKFSGGIRRGKLMAKEYAGILLVLLCTIRSGRGQKMLQKRKHFKNPNTIPDWIMLLETLLQWEKWLKKPKMPLDLVKRAKQKHRYIMHLIKAISPRQKGMGLKTTKFHCIMHMQEDMLAYGVPLEVDTKFDEMHHKPTKKAANLTQKDKRVFEKQTATREQEVRLLDLAKVEMDGRAVFEYFKKHIVEPQQPTLVQPPCCCGKGFFVAQHTSGRNHMWDAVKIKGKNRRVKVEQDLIDFLVEVQEVVHQYTGRLVMKSLHKRNGQLFRGHVMFFGSVWRDWVVVDWGRGFGKLPCKIWGFLDLSKLPPNRRISAGGLTNLKPGIYSVVEATNYVEDAMETELITEIETEVGSFGGQERYVTQLKFYLAPVDAFVEPAIVVPNIGGNNNSYLWVKHPGDWSGMFEKWLKDAHNNKELRGNGDLEDEDDVSVASEADDVASDEESDGETEDILDEYAPIDKY